MTDNVNNTGPDSEPDAKKNEAIRKVADLLVDKFDVRYDWHKVLEIRLDDGRWVMVSLEEISDPDERLSEPE